MIHIKIPLICYVGLINAVLLWLLQDGIDRCKGKLLELLPKAVAAE